MPSFECLWRQLEPLVIPARRVEAQAILAVAYGFDEERDGPPRRAHAVKCQEDLRAKDMPSEDEIARRAAAIRAGWTEAERRDRMR